MADKATHTLLDILTTQLKDTNLLQGITSLNWGATVADTAIGQAYKEHVEDPLMNLWHEVVEEPTEEARIEFEARVTNPLRDLWDNTLGNQIEAAQNGFEEHIANPARAMWNEAVVEPKNRAREYAEAEFEKRVLNPLDTVVKLCA